MWSLVGRLHSHRLRRRRFGRRNLHILRGRLLNHRSRRLCRRHRRRRASLKLRIQIPHRTRSLTPSAPARRTLHRARRGLGRYRRKLKHRRRSRGLTRLRHHTVRGNHTRKRAHVHATSGYLRHRRRERTPRRTRARRFVCARRRRRRRPARPAARAATRATTRTATRAAASKRPRGFPPVRAGAKRFKPGERLVDRRRRRRCAIAPFPSATATVVVVVVVALLVHANHVRVRTRRPPRVPRRRTRRRSTSASRRQLARDDVVVARDSRARDTLIPSTSIDTLIDGIRIPSMPRRFQPPRARTVTHPSHASSIAHIAIDARCLSRATHEVQIHRSSSRSIDRSTSRPRAGARSRIAAAPQSTLARP